MAREWESRVDEARDVQKLVHLAMRMTPVDVEDIRGTLLKRRQTIYEQELTLQAARVGCPGRQGRLVSGPSLSALNDQSRADAESIVNTYNYDLMVAIENIYNEVPTANRYVYARRLQEWEDRRAQWKQRQIAEYTEGTARAMAQQDFVQHNDITGVAYLEPRMGKCPVCIGWIQRDEVPLYEAQNQPPPYHVNCPHNWRTDPNKVPKSECPNLWMGE